MPADYGPANLTPDAAALVAETLGYRYEPASGDPVAQAAAFDPAEGAVWAHNLELTANVRARDTEIEKLREQLAQVDELRAEIARLAPDLGRTVPVAELMSILDTARRAVDCPMTDRCGCGFTDDTTRVQFHRRGDDQCRAEQ